MVGERIELPSPWSRTKNRFANLLFRLGVFCVSSPLFAWYLAANGPKLDPSFASRVGSGKPVPFADPLCQTNLKPCLWAQQGSVSAAISSDLGEALSIF